MQLLLSGSTASGVAFSMDPGTSTASRSEFIYSSEICESSFQEEMLGKMAELIETVISWGLRTLLGVAAGLQVVRGLVAPVMDSLKRSAVGKTAGALPGIGAR